MPDNASHSSQRAARLHSLAIHLLRRARSADAESGLSAARLSALSVLVFGGERTIGELALAEQVSPPSMTRLVNGLERDGLVRRRRSSADARVTVVRATAKGARILEAGRDRRVALLERILAGLDASQRATVDAALEALEAAVAGRLVESRAGGGQLE